MCGRYSLLHSWEEVVGLYRLTDTGFRPNLSPRLDIRPTTDILAIHDGGAGFMRWGFERNWSKGPLINAKAEGVAEKPTFKDGFQNRRCLIPASGFYEWATIEGRVKQRYYITSISDELLTFAGLWESKDGVESCTIITTTPNDVVKPIHSRMPAVLAPEDWDAWLAEPRLDILKPAPVDDMIAYRVRSDIKDDGPLDQLEQV